MTDLAVDIPYLVMLVRHEMRMKRWIESGALSYAQVQERRDKVAESIRSAEGLAVMRYFFGEDPMPSEDTLRRAKIIRSLALGDEAENGLEALPFAAGQG